MHKISYDTTLISSELWLIFGSHTVRVPPTDLSKKTVRNQGPGVSWAEGNDIQDEKLLEEGGGGAKTRTPHTTRHVLLLKPLHKVSSSLDGLNVGTQTN